MQATIDSIDRLNRAESLLLSVVNDGKSYPRRCELARASRNELNYRAIVRRIAETENRQFDTGWTELDICNCAVLLGDYMRRHIAEVAA